MEGGPTPTDIGTLDQEPLINNGPKEPSGITTVAVVGALRVLVVCTANVCRSPMGASLLSLHLSSVGVSAVVTSAGVAPSITNVDPDARRAAEELGADLSVHLPRGADGDVIERDGSHLVLTMTSRHAREIAARVPAALPRTFTFREFHHRLTSAGFAAVPDLDELIASLHCGRTPLSMLQADGSQDIKDPYGKGLRAVRETARELDRIAFDIALHLAPYRHLTSHVDGVDGVGA